ncbi:hypothetical protein BC941DRAFT_470939 [Chlamydoabsidia padenii]|nr:hypothetical protein BC941DRAFT_470939 [Chlamydoabsidia padenii]
MKETADTLNKPPHYLATTLNDISNQIQHNQNKPTVELILCHDQWRNTPVVSSQQQQQQQHLPSVRCTLIKDQDDKILFYRPTMPLHTLFQVPDEPPSIATGTISRHSKKRHTLDTPCSIDLDCTRGLQQQQYSHTTTIDSGNHANLDHPHDEGGADQWNMNQIKDNNSKVDSEEDIHQRLVIPKPRQSYATLYDVTDDRPLWTLSEQDWHTMTLVSRQHPHYSVLMTTSTFSFTWKEISGTGDGQQRHSCLFPYQWQMQLGDDEETIDLLCEQWQPNQTKRPVAWLGATRLTLFGCTSTTTTSGNHNKDDTIIAETAMDGTDRSTHGTMRPLDSLDTFLILSGLLLYELISSQIRTLGGGIEAMKMMIERQQQALAEETRLFYQQGLSTTTMVKRDLDQDRPYQDAMMDEDWVMDDHRWSASGSLKSLELDQGWWRCWWHWIPCCMPGSWCDRIWIKTWGGQRYHHQSRVTRRMQGWQQHV